LKVATYSFVVGPLARVHVTLVAELKPYTEEAAAEFVKESLTDTETKTWLDLQANTARKMEWLLGRIVLKEAVSEYLLETQLTKITAKQIEITRTEAGAPGVVWTSENPLPLPVISLAHTKGVIVAAVASAEGVGVDVEKADRRAPVVERVLTETEKKLFEDGRISLLSAVVAKEAAAKAVGVGLGGDLRRWPIVYTEGTQHFVTCIDVEELALVVDFLEVPNLILGVCVIV
jgi:phosphopantetheinyl transferase (holo-ACP synthase)